MLQLQELVKSKVTNYGKRDMVIKKFTEMYIKFLLIQISKIKIIYF